MLARFLVGLLSASIVFGLAAASAGADMFTFRDLDSCCSLAGQSAIFTGASGAAAVNDNGDVVGFAIGADGNRHAYLFKNGEFTLLDTIPQPTGSGYADTAPFSYATDVNDSDFIVGASSDDQISRDPFGGTHGVAWEPTATSVSTEPLDYGQLEVDSINDCNFTQGLLDCYTAATNVNAKDDVAGYGEFLENPSGSYCWCTFPWLIPGGNRALKEVGTSEGPAPDTPSTDMLVYDHTGTDYYTSGINDSDQVVVSPDPSTPSDTNTSAIYPGDIPIPFEASRLDGAYHSINDSGEVIGTDESTNLAQIYIKSGTVDTLSPLSGDTQTQAEAINNDGDVVGYSEGAGGCPSAVEWNHTDYTDPIDLNTAAPSRDEELLVATDISNTGVIVGQGGPCSQSTGYTANIDPWELTGGSSQPTSTTIACTPANLPVTQLSACTVTVADTAPSATQTPSGTVTVASSLTGTLSPANHCTLAAAKTAGQATCHLSYTPTEAGAATLTASY
jgi:probable HAF family extracellular repeat protein